MTVSRVVLAALLLLLTAAELQERAQGAALQIAAAVGAGGEAAPAAPASAGAREAQHAPESKAAPDAVVDTAAQVSRAATTRRATLLEALPFTAEFLHPLAQQRRHEARAAAVQAHADMQHWLASFFTTPASRLTSGRLQQGRRAAQEAAAAADAAAAAAAEAGGLSVPLAAGTAGLADEPVLVEGFLDVPPSSNSTPGCTPGASFAACARASAEQQLVHSQPEQGLDSPGGFPMLRWPRFEEDAQRWAAVPGLNGSCLPRQAGERISRDYLLVVPVGNDISSVLKWMDRPTSATFDLVLLHYGSSPEPPSCPACAAVLSMAGPKWHLVWQATRLPAWRQLTAGKRAVMVADDDLIMDTCVINRAFEVFSAYGLLIGQPSLCRTAHRPSWYLHLLQDRTAVMRFVTMVEIMAPIFEMDTFQNFIRPSLHDSYTGWGLDFVWPFLLQYPRDRIGVIDDTCMTHPHFAQAKQGEGSVYAALAKIVPYDSREEEARRDGQYSYYPSDIRALGFGYRPIEVLGIVPRPPPPPAAEAEAGFDLKGPVAEPLNTTAAATPAGQNRTAAAALAGQNATVAAALAGQKAGEAAAAVAAGPASQARQAGAEAQPRRQEQQAQQAPDPQQAQQTQAQQAAQHAQQAKAQQAQSQAKAQQAQAQQAQAQAQAQQAQAQQAAQHAQQAKVQQAAARLARHEQEKAAAQLAARSRQQGAAAAARPDAQPGPLGAQPELLSGEQALEPSQPLPKPAQLTHKPALLAAHSQERRAEASMSADAMSAVYPRSAAASERRGLLWGMQPWLLFVQLSFMLGAAVLLALYSSKRRPGSPRQLPVLHPHPA